MNYSILIKNKIQLLLWIVFALSVVPLEAQYESLSTVQIIFRLFHGFTDKFYRQGLQKRKR